MERLWILGATDPEMQAIEKLLRECGELVSYARDESGARVHPANAYRAHCEEARGFSGTAYMVECAVDVLDADVSGSVDCDCQVIRIDHHRPADPGYGKPPAEFMSASSIGQVISELARLDILPDSDPWGSGACSSAPSGVFQRWHGSDGVTVSVPARNGGVNVTNSVPRELVLTAATDHCLGAAYRSECPGVDPDELMRWRAESRARFQGRDVGEVLDDIEAAKARILAAPLTIFVDCDCSARDAMHGRASGQESCAACGAPVVCVRDLRMTGRDALPGTRGAAIPELPEAALRLGEAYITGPLNTPDGRQKIVCSGTEEQVRVFLGRWAPANGIVDTYGDHARGFAGGYLESGGATLSEREA